MFLFNSEISNWGDWGEIFQSVPSFLPIIEKIFKNEKLPFSNPENLNPGTNAVFKVGRYVVKIFAPAESGIDQSLDLKTELFAVKRMKKSGIPAPALIAKGIIKDKYNFTYMITKYIKGMIFTEAVKNMTEKKKKSFGRKLRALTDKINTDCRPFNNIDVINDKDSCGRWNKYCEEFKSQRAAYIKSHDFGRKVFVHGDLCSDNILVTPAGKIYLVDFADAVLAPKIYEHSLVAVELFELDKTLLSGYFGNYTHEELTEICFNGLLIHDYGGDIINCHIDKAENIHSLDVLRTKLAQAVESSI